MITLTQKERETVIILFKDYTNFYNANSISKILNISHVGAQKIFKRLLQENLVISKTIGKSIIYKLNFSNDYVTHLVAFILADEANKFKRWKEEFKELFKKDRIVMLFGSTIKDYAHAQDIDIMIVLENKEVKEVNTVLKKKEEILPKKLHAIKLTHLDLLENLKKKDKAFLDIIKNAIIIYGQDIYVEILKNVTSL
ncbi:MAG TPA: nucleotidyltransferase domain-containing protein [Candidatus Nanoarchaeia archaeon]|nr:nucleotidyltransferase domain-containing protein [Candidatus Nanoarchaeia archaeon]